MLMSPRHPESRATNSVQPAPPIPHLPVSPDVQFRSTFNSDICTIKSVISSGFLLFSPGAIYIRTWRVTPECHGYVCVLNKEEV
jgi:hypothetical protein